MPARAWAHAFIPQDRDSSIREEASLVVPRRGAENAVPLPTPLSKASAAQVRHILALHRSGNFEQAIKDTARLQDDTLLGDILADRYTNPAYHPSVDQLLLWLRSFPRYPDAPAIRTRLVALAAGRKINIPAIASTPVLGNETSSTPLPEEADPGERNFTRNALLDRTVMERSLQGEAGVKSALRLIDTTRGMSDMYAAQLQTEIGQRLLAAGKTAAALELTRKAFERSGRRLGNAGFIAGIAAWKLGDFHNAGLLFEAASYTGMTSASIRASSAFWAARVKLHNHDTTGYRLWLRRAAAAPYTFYGILANHLIKNGRHDAPHTMSLVSAILPIRHESVLTLSEVDIEAVKSTPVGRRFFSLLQIGEKDRAEALIRQFLPTVQNDVALCRSVQLIAQQAHLTSLSAQLATILQARDGYPRNDARFPTPTLKPRHGYRLKPSLVYALVRLESNFNPRAVSAVGARGLMQLMPVAVQTVEKQAALAGLHLEQPAINLDLGQRYLLHLAQATIRHAQNDPRLPAPKGGDFIRVLASYNSGPAGMIRIDEALGDIKDPLLYIESLPPGETRNYVHRALTYLWVYSAKMNMSAPSLIALGQNRWPAFHNQLKAP